MAEAPEPFLRRTVADEGETADLAAGLAALLRAGDLILLDGTLGAGKTALARQVIRSIAGDRDLIVASPTFTFSQVYDDLPLTVAVEQGGMTAHPMQDPTAMLRCLDVEGLADELDVTLFPGEDGASFLNRILPADNLVFWPADRF